MFQNCLVLSNVYTECSIFVTLLFIEFMGDALGSLFFSLKSASSLGTNDEKVNVYIKWQIIVIGICLDIGRGAISIILRKKLTTF